MQTRFFLLAFALLFALAPAAHAQYGPANRSNVRGFVLGGALNGSSIKLDDSDDIETGAGLSLRIGYGFNDNLAGEIGLHGANIEHYGLRDTYALGHFDLGLRYSFRAPTDAARPYLGAAYSGRAAQMDLVGIDLRGAGPSLKGGLEYFFTPHVALDVGLAYTFGTFSQGRTSSSGWVDLGSDAPSATSARVDLGIAWHP